MTPASANLSNSSAQLFIQGRPVNVVNVVDGSILIRTSLRLCPGRTVSVRLGRGAGAVMAIETSLVHNVDQEGLMYEVGLAVIGAMPEALAPVFITSPVAA